ncbi:MAG: hypothetical protein ACYCO9_18760 [Streptosporangiaceae bacterium]
MRLIKAHDLPGRIITGAYILHSGIEKLSVDEERAAGLHKMASGAYPFLGTVPPARFTRLLAITEITIGSALLVPVVPTALAGAALTGFSGGLVSLYARTPALRKPGSIWPSQAGTAVSKDAWMLGIGLSLLISAVEGRRGGK